MMKRQTKKRILLIDNYDSFTYNLQDYFLQLNTNCSVIRNDALSLAEIKAMAFDALVLSPGPKTPKDAGIMMDLIAYYHDKLPILGICLGHQGIGEYFGAKLQRANSPMHGKTSILRHQNHPLFKSLPDHFKVMRYHSLILEQLAPTKLKIIASTDNEEVMAICHQSYPIIGLQFHPESILTEHGLAMLSNWLEIIEREKVYIREMAFSEISDARQICIAAFDARLREESSAKGITHFINEVIDTANMEDRMVNDSHFFVAIKNKQIIGVTELRPPGHLAIIFIDPDHHGKGLGKRMMGHAVELTKVLFPDSTALTLNSTPSVVNFYLDLGFQMTESEQVKNGIRYVPMKIDL